MLHLVIGFQRNEGVLSLAKALPVYIRFRGGPQACYGILPQWLKLGMRLLSISFLWDFDQLKVSVQMGELGIIYTGRLGEIEGIQ